VLYYSYVDFHRAAISVAGNSPGPGIRKGNSRQALIIFGLEIRSHPDLDAVVAQHEEFRRFLFEGDAADLVPMLREHITGWHSRAGDRPLIDTLTVNEEKNDVPIA